jgi:hypothetical protein
MAGTAAPQSQHCFDAILEAIVREVEQVSPGLIVVDSFRTLMCTAVAAPNGIELQGFLVPERRAQFRGAQAAGDENARPSAVTGLHTVRITNAGLQPTSSRPGWRLASVP